MSEEEKVVENEDQGAEVELEQPETEESGGSEGTATASASEGSDDRKDEELGDYSKRVQERIKKLTEKYRREERDREEAVRIAQQLKQENDQMKARMQSLDQGYLTEYGSRLENQLNLAKQAYRDAHDRGDADKMFEAQQALNRIGIEQERYRLAKQRQEQNEKLAIQRQSEPAPQQMQQAAPQQQQQAPEPDPRAQDWAAKNEWFGQDEVMTYAAFGIHRKLVEEEGFDPSSDDYYNEIDHRMRKEFPNRFTMQKGSSAQVASADTSASRRKPGRRTVKLTPSEVQMAKRLNVPLEEYAKYVKR
jgi:hypothetical protein